MSGDISDISFLLKIALAANATFEDIAVRKPNHVNDNSVAEASATPPMTGIKERYTGNGYTVPETKYTPRAENTGSNVFTVCVNETATVAKDTFDKQCPNACKNAGNVNAFKNVGEGFSNLTSLVVQKNVMMSKPTPKCTQDTNHGNGK